MKVGKLLFISFFAVLLGLGAFLLFSNTVSAQDCLGLSQQCDPTGGDDQCCGTLTCDTNEQISPEHQCMCVNEFEGCDPNVGGCCSGLSCQENTSGGPTDPAYICLDDPDAGFECKEEFEGCDPALGGCCAGLSCQENEGGGPSDPANTCQTNPRWVSGSYSCEWAEFTTSPTTVEEVCVIKDNSCNSGYIMEPECSSITDETECNSITNNVCVEEDEAEGGTFRCAWSSGGRTCLTQDTCAEGYEPAVNCERFTVERYGEEGAKALCDQNYQVRACVAEGLAGIGEACDGHEDCKDRLVCANFECRRSEVGDDCDEDRNCPLSTTCTGGICIKDDTRGGGGFVPCGGISNPCTFCHFFLLIHNVVEFLLFTLGPILASLMIVVGGFYVLTSRGNQSQYNKGKNYIKWALLGYLLMLGAWLIINTILTMLDLADWVSIGDWWKPSC